MRGRLLVVVLAILALGCEPAIAPSAATEGSPPAATSPTPAVSLGPPDPPERAESVPEWRADQVPSTEHWATIVVVLDLAQGIDASTARDLRLAVVELMVNATDGTEIGVVRATKDAETLVQPVPMGTGRADAIERVWSAPVAGERNLAAGLARAHALVEQSQVDSINRGILLLATGTDASVGLMPSNDQIRDVHAIAYRSQPADESILATIALYGSGLFGAADDLQDLARRVADVRRKLEQMSLVAAGTLDVDGNGQASAPVAVGEGQVFVRVALHGVSSDAVIVTNPDGEAFTTSEPADDVRRTEFGDSVALGVGAASSGDYQISVHGAPAGRDVPYEVETFFKGYPDARSRADLDATEGMRVGYMDDGLPIPAAVSATVQASDGTEQTVELGAAPEGESLVCCLENMREGHLSGPIAGGPLVVTVRSVGGDGPAHYERLVRFGGYMWPAVDSDGDGIRDQVELRNAMNPADRADGALDADTDGLSMARELGELGTDPFDYDTDDGGEGDGIEVDAGRDPKNPGDDVAQAACVDESNMPDSAEFEWQDDAPRAPDLENLLPDTLLGQRMTKTSISGPPQLHGTSPGFFWYALVQCIAGSPERLEVAYATRADWSGLVVVAIRVGRVRDGTVESVPATELADAFLHRIVPTDNLGPRPYVLEGRTATMLESGMLVYPHDDVLFMTMPVYIGDCFENCGSPPDLEKLAADLLPKLPGD
jgi:hypothetical protein